MRFEKERQKVRTKKRKEKYKRWMFCMTGQTVAGRNLLPSNNNTETEPGRRHHSKNLLGATIPDVKSAQMKE